MRAALVLFPLLLAVAGCASNGTSGEPPPGPAPTLTLEEVASECERLIGTINAGIAHVEGFSAGKDEDFEQTAQALEAVAQTLVENGYKTPDLQRIGGFYVGVLQNQARVLRAMITATEKGDEKALDESAGQWKMLGDQQDIVVEELNLQCRGRKDGEAPDKPAQEIPQGTVQ